MRHSTALTMLSLFLLAPPALAQTPAGGDSPQAVVAAIQEATAADSLAMAVPYLAPAARQELAKEGVTGLLMALAFSDPDDAMPGSATPPKAELAKKQKNYKAAVDIATKVFAAHGITGVVGKPVLAEATQKPINTAIAKTDTVVLMRELVGALDAIGPLLGMKKSEKPQMPFSLGPVSDYKINGDKATARAEKETLDFVKIDGRWYLTPPAPAEGR